MKQSNISIFQTSDYSIFKTQAGNRSLAANDLKRIEKKILANNLLKYHPILVGKDYRVIDGQHRLEVAKRNNLEVSFIVMQSKSSLKTTQSINTTGKAWQVKDFLRSYIALGKKEYIKFNSYLEKYKFLTISQLIDISVIGRNKDASGNETFRNGDIELRDETIIRKILNDINHYISTTLKISKMVHFQRFIMLANRRGIIFDHKRMVAKIESNIEIVKRIPSDPHIYAEVLGDLYNHKLSQVNKVNFNTRLIK